MKFQKFQDILIVINLTDHEKSENHGLQISGFILKACVTFLKGKTCPETVSIDPGSDDNFRILNGRICLYLRKYMKVFFQKLKEFSISGAKIKRIQFSNV